MKGCKLGSQHKKGAHSLAVKQAGFHSIFRVNAIVAGLLLINAANASYADQASFGSLKSGLGDGSEFSVGDAVVTVKGAVNFGAVIRAENSDPNLTGSANQMTTLNDGDLNYQQGDSASTAFESYLQADLRYRNLGLFTSAKAWYDYALIHHDVPHGNSVNGYQSGTPLSDNGFVTLDKFTNVVLDDAYWYVHFKPADMPLLVRFGRQTIPWSTPTTMGSALQQVNASDYNALSRSSAISEEVGIPALSLYGKLTITPKLDVDGFVQAKYEPNAYPGCGTFFSTSDYAQSGCNALTLNGALLSAVTRSVVNTTDAQSLINPIDVVTRAPDHIPDRTQFGASTRYLIDDVGVIGFYAAKVSSKSAYTGVHRNGPGILTPALANVGLAEPTGLSSQFYRAYPEELTIFGATFKTQLADKTGIYAELSYVPNQQIAWNGADLLNGVLSGAGPLGYLSKLPVGASVDGFDQFKVSQFLLGAVHPLGQVLGGSVKISGEVGLKYVSGLPPENEMRYGRVGWGMAPSNADPICLGTAATCALDGFVTTSAWGARVKLENNYAAVAQGWDLTPSLILTQDINGYSYDGIFSKGRYSAIWGLSAIYNKSYVVNASYFKTGGGDYNIVSDRSMYTLTVGGRF